MSRSTLALLLLASPSLAAADVVHGAAATEAAAESFSQMAEKVPRGVAKNKAYPLWSNAQHDQQAYDSIYKTTGQVKVDGPQLSGELEIRRTYGTDTKGTRKRSFTWNWQTQQGRMRADDNASAGGFKVGARSSLAAASSKDGSEATATRATKETIPVDQALRDDLHSNGLLRRAFSTPHPVAAALGLKREVLKQTVAGAEIQLDSTYERSSTQAFHTLPKGQRPANKVTRERSYTLTVGGKSQPISEQGYRALKARVGK